MRGKRVGTCAIRARRRWRRLSETRRESSTPRRLWPHRAPETPVNRFWVSGFRFWISGSRVSGFVYRVSCFVFRVMGLMFRISGFGSWDLGSGFWASGFGFQVSGSGFRVSSFGFRVSGFGLRDEEHLDHVLANRPVPQLDGNLLRATWIRDVLSSNAVGSTQYADMGISGNPKLLPLEPTSALVRYFTPQTPDQIAKSTPQFQQTCRGLFSSRAGD
jgi:hypothetical protein